MLLDVARLTAGYGGHSVFADLDFTLREGELMVIFGPNGAGKSTLLKCLNAMLKPESGAVMVENTSLFALKPREIARRIGYVPQQSKTSRLTVFDAILMGRRPHLGWRVGKRDLQVVDAVIRRLHLESLTMQYIDRLSGGELQKVCIARSLVQEPKLLLLDEPTASLDLKNQLEIMRTIRFILANHPVGVIMTMHDLNLALRFVDTFVLLKDGAVHIAGRPCQLTASMISETYGVDVDILWHGQLPLVVPREPAGFQPEKSPASG